jgi:hypothetical protein
LSRNSACFVLTLAILSNAASAEIRHGSTTFSLIYKGEQNTGFNYVSNSWRHANFEPSTYVVTKLDPAINKDECPYFQSTHPSPEPSLFPADALRGQPDELVELSKHATGYGCYKIKQLGGQYNSQPGSDCTETWYGVQGNAHLIHVDCKGSEPNFAFDFDGAFAATSTYTVFDLSKLLVIPPDADKSDKGSIYLEIGNCAQVR